MNLYLFSVNKRINSTKRPDLSSGKELTVQLKDEISFENPVFKIKSDVIGGTFTPVAFNYAYAPYWMRYYFITDWKFINGCWECYCSVDVLASFKNQINNTTAYVIRSSSNYDTNIIDTFILPKRKKQSHGRVLKDKSIIPVWQMVVSLLVLSVMRPHIGLVRFLILRSL